MNYRFKVMNNAIRILFRHRLRSRPFSTGANRKTPFEGDAVIVPDQPIRSEIDPSLVTPPPLFDKALLNHLERLSLVRFTDEEAVANLRSAVFRANRLLLVDTTGVEPMHTVWEEQECPLHEDEPERPMSVKEVLSNASVVEEDYLVTPPGNVPLEDSSSSLDLKLINEWDSRGRPADVQVKKTRVNQ